ncbi:MAG TPA: MCP four helix bundle domain-containing protein, partial [Afipia sp.]
MLSRFSISTKLIALVSLMLLALASMGAFAIVEMRAINASAQDIQTNWLPSIRLIGELRTQSARYRAVLRDYLTEPDEKFMAEIQSNLDARAADYAAANKAYAAMLNTPEEVALYKSLDANWTKFLDAAKDVVAAAHVYNTTAARAANADRAVPAGREMDTVLKKMVELNDKGAAEAGRRATDDYQSGFIFVAGLLLIMIALGLVASVLIVRDIAHGIASVITPMRALANGDLSAPVPNFAESTEIGRIS